MHFAKQKRTISRQGRTDHVSDTEHTYRKGKRKMSRSGGSRERSRAMVGRTGRKRKLRKIRERAFTCVENLERYRSRGRYTGAGRTPGNKYNKESDATQRERRGMDKERRKRRTGRKNEDDGNKRERRFCRQEGKKKKEKSPDAVHEGKSGVKQNEKGNRKRLKNEWKESM